MVPVRPSLRRHALTATDVHQDRCYHRDNEFGGEGVDVTMAIGGGGGVGVFGFIPPQVAGETDGAPEVV